MRLLQAAVIRVSFSITSRSMKARDSAFAIAARLAGVGLRASRRTTLAKVSRCRNSQHLDGRGANADPRMAPESSFSLRTPF